MSYLKDGEQRVSDEICRPVRRAIYSGTFDPITNGHMDILTRGLKIYDEIIIAVATSHAKKPMFSLDSRVKLIETAIADMQGLKVEAFDTLMVDFARKHDVYNIIRGLRTNTDFEYELQMSYANSSLDKDIDTVFLMPTLKNAFVSSSIVRELIRFNGDYSHLVPQSIQEQLNEEVSCI